MRYSLLQIVYRHFNNNYLTPTKILYLYPIFTFFGWGPVKVTEGEGIEEGIEEEVGVVNRVEEVEAVDWSLPRYADLHSSEQSGIS